MKSLAKKKFFKKALVTKPRVNKAWFDARLYEVELSQNKLADIVGMDRSAMSLLLHGRRKMSVVEAGEIAKALYVNPEELLRHAGGRGDLETGEKNIPILCVAGDLLEVKPIRPEGPQSVEVPPGCHKFHALRVQCEGSSYNRNVFIYRPLRGIQRDALGRLCVVKPLGSDKTYVRQVLEGYETGWYTLNGMGAAPTEHVRLESASPIRWIRQ